MGKRTVLGSKKTGRVVRFRKRSRAVNAGFNETSGDMRRVKVHKVGKTFVTEIKPKRKRK